MLSIWKIQELNKKFKEKIIHLFGDLSEVLSN